jgi:hypothetical protein
VPNPTPPPPFQPYRADPNADSKQNLVGFLEWVADGIYRVHQISEANLRYSRALYEHEARKSAAAGHVQPPHTPYTAQQVLFDLGKVAVQNRAAFGKFLRGFIGK